MFVELSARIGASVLGLVKLPLEVLFIRGLQPAAIRGAVAQSMGSGFGVSFGEPGSARSWNYLSWYYPTETRSIHSINPFIVISALLTIVCSSASHWSHPAQSCVINQLVGFKNYL